LRTCEKFHNFTQRRQGTEIRNKQLLCFSFALCGFAPLRDALLLAQELFYSFLRYGLRPFARQVTGWGGRFANRPYDALGNR
jgi:hypothetical protein